MHFLKALLRSATWGNKKRRKLASRLCDEARDGQILVTQRAAAKLEDTVELESLGELSLKGFHRAVKVFNAAAI